MASLLENIPYPSSIEVLELLAARRDVLFVQEVLLFVQEVGLGNSIFEEYSYVVINSLQKDDMFSFALGYLV